MQFVRGGESRDLESYFQSKRKVSPTVTILLLNQNSANIKVGTS